MSNFIYAAELKKTFRCYGHFYRLNIEGQEPLLCRSVLEITSLPREAVGAATDPDDLFAAPSAERSLPDAVVIMMNPMNFFLHYFLNSYFLARVKKGRSFHYYYILLYITITLLNNENECLV